MNPEIYPQIHSQVHSTTTAIGRGAGETPTPVKAYVSKSIDGYYVSAEGTDGQQVVDLIVSALRQIPDNKKRVDNGFFEWAFGLLFCAFVTVAVVNIFFLMNPQPQSPQIQLQEGGKKK